MTAFNERLKALRESAGLTQEGLARAAGVSVSTVSKLEQLGQDPAWSTVVKIAAGLGVSVEAFASDGGALAVGTREASASASATKGKITKRKTKK